VTATRLRPRHEEATLIHMYAKPHVHSMFTDHIARVDATIAAGRALLPHDGAMFPVAADLSCGDGAVLDSIPAARRIYGDLAPGYEHTGPLESTITAIDRRWTCTCAAKPSSTWTIPP
jgi:hypothetical protein